MTVTGPFDVIIAGAGPAGSTAGFILSKSGLRVLIIDKSRFPRRKVCGGLITGKTVRLLERVFGLTVQSLRKEEILEYETPSFEVCTRNSLITKGNSEIPFRFINRERFDDFLLRRAREAGAEIIEGDRIVSLDVLRNAVRTASGHMFSSKVIIGADGANSRVRRSFPTDLFGRDTWIENLAAAHETVVSRNFLNHQVNHPVLYYGFVEYGYGWMFPNRDNVIIGLCGLRSRNSKNILSAFREFLAAVSLPLTEETQIFSAVLPYGNFLPEPVFRNILLVGDAAGFADPLLGEGIYYAQRSAELAAEAVSASLKGNGDEAVLRNSYVSLLHDHIFSELLYAGKIQETLFKRLKNFGWLPLKIVMNMFRNMPVETVHGLRSYRWMRKRVDI